MGWDFYGYVVHEGEATKVPMLYRSRWTFQILDSLGEEAESWPDDISFPWTSGHFPHRVAVGKVLEHQDALTKGPPDQPSPCPFGTSLVQALAAYPEDAILYYKLD